MASHDSVRSATARNSLAMVSRVNPAPNKNDSVPLIRTCKASIGGAPMTVSTGLLFAERARCCTPLRARPFNFLFIPRTLCEPFF